MEAFVSAIASVFGILNDVSIFGVPVLLWLIIGSAFTLIGKFIVGKK